ncbi:MAG: hypothetical protein GY832_19120 [Chloroflexi bacterium]|nr:hypothetical protein [Chloroflexota bacterium]
MTRYQDPNGDIREAHIRVPLLSGVYWTGGEAESSKTETADAFHRDTEISELLDENRELVA